MEVRDHWCHEYAGSTITIRTVSTTPTGVVEIFLKKVWGGYLKKWPFFSIYYERFIPVSKTGNRLPLDITTASAPWKVYTTSRRYHVRATVAGVKGRGQAQSDEDMGKQWYPARLGHTPRGGLPTRMGWGWDACDPPWPEDLRLTSIFLSGRRCTAWPAHRTCSLSVSQSLASSRSGSDITSIIRTSVMKEPYTYLA